MSDALERIRNRNRPKVKPRDAAISPQNEDINASRHTDSETHEPELRSQLVQSETPSQFLEHSLPIPSEDILTSRHLESEISKHQEATLPPQSTPLNRAENERSKIQDISTSRHLDVGISKPRGSIDIRNSRHQNSETAEYPDIQTSRHIDSETPEALIDLPVKRSTFRMEEALTERLHELCRSRKVSREVFMEAMFEYMEAHPAAMEQVMAEAIKKNEYRQQLANRKRAESMIKRFGS